MTPLFPPSVRWWLPAPPSVAQQASAITVLSVLQSPTPRPCYQHKAISFYLGSDALPLVTPPCYTPLRADCSIWAFQCHHISCAVFFCLESLNMIFFRKTFIYLFFIKPLSRGCWQSTYCISFQIVLSHSVLPVSCSVSPPLMAIELFDQSNWGLSALFKVTSAVAFVGWRGVSYQTPPSPVHSPSWSGKSPQKPSTVTPFSIISSFICIVCCSVTIGSLLFGLAIHTWLNLLFISVHLSHLFRLHRRMLKQHVGRVLTCVGQRYHSAFSLHVIFLYLMLQTFLKAL